MIEVRNDPSLLQQVRMVCLSSSVRLYEHKWSGDIDPILACATLFERWVLDIDTHEHMEKN